MASSAKEIIEQAIADSGNQDDQPDRTEQRAPARMCTKTVEEDDHSKYADSNADSHGDPREDTTFSVESSVVELDIDKADAAPRESHKQVKFPATKGTRARSPSTASELSFTVQNKSTPKAKEKAKTDSHSGIDAATSPTIRHLNLNKIVFAH